MDQHRPCLAQGCSSHRAPFLTLDDLFWFLYLYPLRMLSALGFQELIYRLGGLFQFRAKQRAELAARRMLAARSAGITGEEAPRIARRMLANSQSRMLDDLILSWPSRARKLRCAGIEGLEHLEEAIVREWEGCLRHDLSWRPRWDKEKGNRVGSRDWRQRGKREKWKNGKMRVRFAKFSPLLV